MKQIFFTILSILCFLFSSAQLYLGGKIGLTNPWIIQQNNITVVDGFNNQFARGSDLGYKIKLGFTIGFSAGYMFSDKFGIEGDLMFETAGQKYNGIIRQDTDTSTFFDVDVDRNVNLNYMRLPILFRYQKDFSSSSSLKKWSYVLGVGPTVGYLVGTFESVDINYPGIPHNLKQIPTNEKFQKFDLGFALQNGVQYNYKNYLLLRMSLNFHLGFLDINSEIMNDEAYYEVNNGSYKQSRNFSVGLVAGVYYSFAQKRFY